MARDSLAECRRSLDDSGPAVIGAMLGASCFQPVYRPGFVFSRDLQKLAAPVPVSQSGPQEARASDCFAATSSGQRLSLKGRQDELVAG